MQKRNHRAQREFQLISKSFITDSSEIGTTTISDSGLSRSKRLNMSDAGFQPIVNFTMRSLDISAQLG